MREGDEKRVRGEREQERGKEEGKKEGEMKRTSKM